MIPENVGNIKQVLALINELNFDKLCFRRKWWSVRWESGNVTTQPWEINNRKSEVIAFVLNVGMNVTANNF